MTVTYQADLAAITPADLLGFFEGWPSPPSPDQHLALLENSYRRVLARDEDTGRVIGFINAISDGVLSAYVPLLEVLPEYRHRGIGSGLVERMLEALSELYMVDVVADADLVPFYERFGFVAGTALMIRRYHVLG
jgi:ribosomal protein S18 acetylase RimI-like enzyme